MTVTLSDLKKRFMDIAIRNGCTHYLMANKVLGRSNLSINSDPRTETYFSAWFGTKNVIELYNNKAIANDYEIKGFLVDLEKYARAKGYVEVMFLLIDNKITVDASVLTTIFENSMEE